MTVIAAVAGTTVLLLTAAVLVYGWANRQADRAERRAERQADRAERTERFGFKITYLRKKFNAEYALKKRLAGAAPSDAKLPDGI